ncbi:MAG: RagB/SusD family nutrient uptake outer membrane protein [Flavobacteriaceae bacterium]|jgi:outer membrane murein-binding lipoprotein Lpp|nr:RagB/SusD family nutrient uptake outer membrane protein [Flavobacteriaceae bacterium]
MNYKKYIAGVVASVVLAGCSSFLDETPDNRTKIDTPEKAKDLLVFAYPSANYMYAMEIMTDNVGDSKRGANAKLDNTAYFTWDVEREESWDSPAEFWQASYKAIAQANQAIESIEKMGAVDAVKNPILGEALLSRAYNHYMIAAMFCQAYDPNTAASELGIPYNTKPETELVPLYERGTLQEVYDKIEADIIKGLPLVQNSNKSLRFHFNPSAAKAFATRFYAMKGDWDKVLEYSNDLGDRPTNFRDYNALSILAPSKYGQEYGSSAEKANLLIAACRSRIAREYPRIRFGVTSPIMANRYGPAFNPYNVDYSFMPYQAGQDVTFYPYFYEYFVVDNQSAGTGQPYVNIPLLTAEEWYLYRVEATIMKGDIDKATQMSAYYAKFKTMGNPVESSVTTARLLQKAGNANDYQPFYTMNDNQRKMMKFVAEMRRSEFLHTGLRWMDIKRFNLPVIHNDALTGAVYKLEPKDLRKAVQLPTSTLNMLTPNPR